MAALPIHIRTSAQDFLGKNTGEGCHFLLLGIFLTQGLQFGCSQRKANSAKDRAGNVRIVGAEWTSQARGVVGADGGGRGGRNATTSLGCSCSKTSKVAIKAAAPCSSLAKWFTRPKRVNTTEIELLFIWLSWAAQQISRVILFHVVTQGQN